MKRRWYDRYPLVPREPELLDTGPPDDLTDESREVLGIGQEEEREVWTTVQGDAEHDRDRWRVEFEERVAIGSC